MDGLASLSHQLRHLSLPMLKAQWGRQLLALLAIALGVALAWGVHLLNASALAEFASGARAMAGTPDLVLRARQGALSDTQLEALLDDPRVAQASPVLEAQVSAPGLPRLRLLGLDPLQAAALTPQLLPLPFAAAADRQTLMQWLTPDAIYLNEAALAALPTPRPSHLELRWTQDGQARSARLRLAGRVAAPGAALAVIDIAGAQQLLGRLGQLDRIDLRLASGITAEEWRAGLAPQLQAGAAPDEGEQLGELSRAYRVNLGVLALMALFSGSFLVFAVISLGVARRLPQLALLGVLGLGARERQALVLAESALLGLLGAALGLALGSGLAALGLRLLGGDLGSGLLAGARPRLHIEPLPLLIYGGLGVAVALAAAWLPARAAAAIAPAQVLKGLGSQQKAPVPAWLGPGLLLTAAALSQVPALFGLPLAAYLAMLCLLAGGLLAVPLLVRSLLALLPSRPSPTLLLLSRRARDQAGEATQMLAGVLVALALSVAMLVMVTSFRDSLQQWLRQVLPADLYVRSALREADGQGGALPHAVLQALPTLPGLQAHARQRSRQALLGETSVGLLAREFGDETQLPLVGSLAQAPSKGLAPIYLNEALRDQLQARPGERLTLRLPGRPEVLEVFVRGVWRDYARQSGALQMSLADYRAAFDDPSVTELYLWLTPGTQIATVQQRLQDVAGEGAALEFAASAELLAQSLRAFDRSFAVTYWLQAMALALGLVGVAASLSAQLLARRRELGLLRHLGLQRAELLRLLLAETALYTSAGALAGLLLGLLLSLVLVFVVNPQSFHWTMSLSLPWARLALSPLAVLLAALATAALVGRGLGRQDAVQAVREDW